MGVTIQERGESFYNPYLTPIVTDLMASGVAEESEGAKVIRSPGSEDALESPGSRLQNETGEAAQEIEPLLKPCLAGIFEGDLPFLLLDIAD